MSQNIQKNRSISHLVCPVSGLPIFQKPHWIDVDFGDNYTITFSTIGDYILLTQPAGYATLEAVKRVVVKTREITLEAFGEERPIVTIQDYGRLEGAETEARKYFIQYHKEQKRIIAAVVINTSLILKISIKLAKKLHIFPFKIFVAKDYPEAIRMALDLLRKNGVEIETIPSQINQEPDKGVTEIASPSSMTSMRDYGDKGLSDEWKIETGNFSFYYRFLEKNISFSKLTGVLNEEHIPPIDQLLERVYNDNILVENEYYHIVDISELKGMGLGVRNRLLTFMKEWYGRHPFRVCVIYGANFFFQTVIKISRAFLPFKIKMEAHFDSTIQFIKTDQSGENKSFAHENNNVPMGIDQVQSYFNELLQFLGGIDWETDKPVDRGLIPESTLHPIGQLYHAIALIKDDLDRLFKDLKSKEEELRRSEKRYRNVLSNVSDFIYFHDLDGVFKESNVFLVAGWEFSEKDLINQNVRDIIPERYRHEFDDYLKRVITKGWDTGLMRVLLKNGAERIVEYRNTLVYDEKGNPIGVQGFASNVTDKIRTETALKVSEAKYRKILESIEEGYCEVDLAGDCTFCNETMARMLGYSSEEFIGMNYKQYITPDNQKRVYEVFNHVFRTGNPVKGLQYKSITKDGNFRIIETSISLIRDGKGNPTGFRGIGRDVTDRIHSEEEKRELEIKLQHARRMEAIGTLAGGVAHDLNNILSGLVSYPELLLMDLPENSPLRGPIETIKTSGEKAATIVQDLLTLARRGVAITEVVNINDVIETYLKSPEHLKILSYHPHVDVETHLADDVSNISGSQVHLTKCLMNLVSNAAEAMSKNGKIVISTANKHLYESYKGYENIAPGDYVVLTVEDEGSGISADDQRRIFEPFYSKKVLGRTGTGLGMAVVWGTLKDHQGYIDLKSIEGKGTSFSLYLPITRKEMIRPREIDSMAEYMGRGETILVVDDVQEQREIAIKILEKLGYKVDAVSSGEEAVEYVLNHYVDLLVLDMIMHPGIDGLETYKRILKINPHQKAIITSGFSETDNVKEAQKFGAGTYIKKPYLFNQFGMAVRNELDRS